MKLQDTIKMMTSDNYNERFKAEYYQLKIRYEGLARLLKGYREGTLNFTPTCSYDLLHAQLVYMEHYLNVLEERSKIENVEL